MEYTKICNKCNKEKSIIEFSTNGYNRIKSQCKECRRIIKEDLKYYKPKRRKYKIENNILYYQCNICKEYKLLNDFEITLRKSKWTNNDILTPRSECKKCRCNESAIYHRLIRKRMSPNEIMSDIEKSRKYKQDPMISFKRYMIRCTKNHSKRENLENSLNVDDIIIPDICPILKTKIIIGDLKFTPTVDRIDNNKGYIKDNIKIISRLANNMK